MESGYEKLEIYRLPKDLAVSVHKMSMKLPKHEMYEEGSQIRRSSKSVPANIVEGYCLRRHSNEYLQFLHRAFASSEETLLHLRLLDDTGSLDDKSTSDTLCAEYEKLGKMIFRFIEAVTAQHGQPFYLKQESSSDRSNPKSQISNPEV